MQLKEFGSRLFTKLYELIFKEKIGHETQQFFTGTSYVAIFTLFGGLLTFVFSALAARILGPTNFGNLALVTTVTAFVSLSIGTGLMAMVKYGSEVQDEVTRARLISTFTLQMALQAAGTIAVCVLFSAQLSKLFGISTELFLFAVGYAAIAAFFVATTSSLLMLFRMRAFALANGLQSVIVLAAFLIFVESNMRSWQAAIFSIYVGNAAIAVILTVYLRQYLKLQYDRLWARRITRYALRQVPGRIAGPFVGIIPLFINIFISTAAVGIYNAYYLPSLTISITLWGVLSAGFFPYASKSRDKLSIFRNVNKAVPYIIVVLVPLVVFIELIAFTFYGSNYPFSAELGLLFAFAATACFFYQCYSSLLASEGTKGATINTLSTVLTLIVVVGLNLVLLPVIGISGAPIALIAAYLIATFYLVSRGHILGRG
jgi:O-antigen/teichoic acid export membrane protein